MSFDNSLISVSNLSKYYHIYKRPYQRLLQLIVGSRKSFYNEFVALEDVSFDIKSGESVGIIGRNGAGKSTLLQLLCGTLSPSSGSINVKGRIAALLELGAGFNPEFSGRDNVFLNATILGLTKEEVESRFDSIAAFADIGDYINQPVKTYSSGMYVRLAFAVIAHVDADILIIDEALAVGDALFVQKCMRFLRQFAKEGSLIFVSHDSAAVTSLCDRAIWLENGRVKQIGPANEVSRNYNAEIYKQSMGSKALDEPRQANPFQAIYAEAKVIEDKRWEFLSNAGLKNAMTVQSFEYADDFSTGQMQVLDLWFEDESAEKIGSFSGGEIVSLSISYMSHIDVDSIIAGFQLKDRRGQILFGDNTCVTTLDSPVPIKAGDTQVAKFKFQMPLLPAGVYAITVSIAEGTQVSHTQHHWIHDALVIQSICDSVSTGIVGIPMIDISIADSSKSKT